MKTRIVLISIISMCACGTRKKENIARQTILSDKFDITKFEELQKVKQNFYFLEDSTKITLIESNSEYQENKIIYRSHFSFNKLYFKDTKTLKNTGEYFQRFPIGTHKEYDKKGRLKSEFNYDSIFTYTLIELTEKLKRDFSIDIMDVGQKISVNRISHTKPPFYDIFITLKMPTRRMISINGLNGNILMDTTFIRHYEK